MLRTGWGLIHCVPCQPCQNDFPKFQSCWTLQLSDEMRGCCIQPTHMLPGLCFCLCGRAYQHLPTRARTRFYSPTSPDVCTPCSCRSSMAVDLLELESHAAVVVSCHVGDGNRRTSVCHHWASYIPGQPWTHCVASCDLEVLVLVFPPPKCLSLQTCAITPVYILLEIKLRASLMLDKHSD